MKYNDETSLDIHLVAEIQDCLHDMIRGNRTTGGALARARLSGIATALHALTGETWSYQIWPDGWVFVNENETECISVEL